MTTREAFEQINPHPDMKDYKDIVAYADAQRLWLIDYSDWQSGIIDVLEKTIKDYK